MYKIITHTGEIHLTEKPNFIRKHENGCFVLTDEETAYYVEKYRPFDKAGAYGIQEWIGYVAIESIEGSFYNVMGLPVQRLYVELGAFCK